MLKRNLLLKYISLVLAVLMLVGSASLVYAAEGDFAPAAPPAEMGSIVFTNFNGYGGQLTIDMQGGTYVIDKSGPEDTSTFVVSSANFYTVPEAANAGPGRMQIDLAPGTYNYTANVANLGSVTGSIEVMAGQVTGLSFYGGDAKTIVHNHSAQEGEDNPQASFSSTVFTNLLVAQEDLTPQIQ
jgi:hypothetical protein